MYQKVVKRLMDIVLCSVALIVLSPIFLIVIIGIKISSKGPIFYYSKRAGIYKQPFSFYKFRSMHLTTSDKHLCVADEDRIFPFGKVMRRLKIDEIPVSYTHLGRFGNLRKWKISKRSLNL